MKFGIELPFDPQGNAGPCYEDTLRIAEVADKVGFDFVSVPHHRFWPTAPSAPLLLLAAIASRTERIRLSTNILILPSLHPLEVAEQVATLDRISHGRAMLGAAIGYQPNEYEAGGLKFESRGARMTEALQILRLVWTQEDVSFAGEHFQFSGVTLQPRPVQAPHPPIMVGAQRPKAVARAARLGDGWLTDSKTALPELVPIVREFWEAVAADPDPRPRTITVSRDVGIGRSRQQVEDVWLPSIMKQWVHYWEMGMRFPDKNNIHERIFNGESISLREFADDRFVAGSPEDCIAEIEKVREVTRCSSMLIRVGYEPQFNEEALRLFAAEVIPAFR